MMYTYILLLQKPSKYLLLPYFYKPFDASTFKEMEVFDSIPYTYLVFFKTYTICYARDMRGEWGATPFYIKLKITLYAISSIFPNEIEYKRIF